jgi:RNA polymerase sigma-70 factor (ECF subfamily)
MIQIGVSVLSEPAAIQNFCSAPCLCSETGFTCPGGRCLVLSAQVGNRAAREHLFTRLYPSVLNQSFRLCRRLSDAEDVAQSSFLFALRALSQLRECRRILPWIRRIVSNTHLLSQRRGRFAPFELLEFTGNSMTPPNAAAHFARPDDLALRRETWRAVKQRLNALTPPLRAVVDLRLLAGHSTDETARRLQISPDAVRARLCRARRALA